MGSCAAIRARPQCGVEVSGHVTENFGNLGNSADIVVFTCPNDISNNLERFHVQVLFRLSPSIKHCSKPFLRLGQCFCRAYERVAAIYVFQREATALAVHSDLPDFEVVVMPREATEQK